MNQNLTACWYPDGSTNSFSYTPDIPQLVPCDPSAPQSPCCTLGETCMGNGLCLSPLGFIYRGACTDKTWVDGSCPKHCVATSGINQGVQNQANFLKLCGFNSSGYPIWTCNFANGCSDSILQFPLVIGNPRQTNITGNMIVKSSPSSTISCPSTATSAARPSSSGFDATTQTRNVGAAVGVSLGFICLLLAGWIIWSTLKRKGTKKQQKNNFHGSSNQQGDMVQEIVGQIRQPMSDYRPKSELP